MNKEDIHILRLMGEINRDGSPTQRELSQRLNLSLGLINTFIKRLVKKGYFKVRTMSKNRVKYFLTPRGVAKKSRLTVEYLRYSVNFYKEIKGLLLNKFKEIEGNNSNTILFFGAGEIAELAYLYLRLTGIQLAGVVDERQNGDIFFEHRVDGLNRLCQHNWDMILLTRLETIDEDIKLLIENGVNPDRIATL